MLNASSTAVAKAVPRLIYATAIAVNSVEANHVNAFTQPRADSRRVLDPPAACCLLWADLHSCWLWHRACANASLMPLGVHEKRRIYDNARFAYRRLRDCGTPQSRAQEGNVCGLISGKLHGQCLLRKQYAHQ